MKYLFITVAFFLIACLSKKEYSSIIIENSSNATIDCAVVHINNSVIRFPQIEPGKIAKDSLNKDLITAPHDVLYTFEIFIKGEKIKQHFFSNDLGYIPQEFAVSVNDSLTIRPVSTK